MMSGIQGSTSISSEMMAQMREEMFTRIDQNGDGQLDQSEMEAFSTEMAERTGQSASTEDIFSIADTNGDGVISKDEFDSARPPGPPPGPPPDSLTYTADAEELLSTGEAGALLDILS